MPRSRAAEGGRARSPAVRVYARRVPETQTGVRVAVAAEGAANVATGLPVLDHLVGELARVARLRITLEVAPGSADEEVAAAALEVAHRPLVVSNVDFSHHRVAGLASDVVSSFLNELAAGAGLTIHVRVLEGRDPEHVLAAIFKALGGALAQACRPPERGGM